jgi:hypothetical protein
MEGAGASTSVNDPVMKTALARRMGIAAANIRQYGGDIARVASYGQPLHDTGQAVTENQTQIMPTQAAEKLLAGGSNIRLLPSQIAYRNATDYGGAVDQMIQQRAAGGTSIGLQFTTGSANRDSPTPTPIPPTRRRRQADAAWQQQVPGCLRDRPTGALRRRTLQPGGAPRLQRPSRRSPRNRTMPVFATGNAGWDQGLNSLARSLFPDPRNRRRRRDLRRRDRAGVGQGTSCATRWRNSRLQDLMAAIHRGTSGGQEARPPPGATPVIPEVHARAFAGGDVAPGAPPSRRTLLPRPRPVSARTANRRD